MSCVGEAPGAAREASTPGELYYNVPAKSMGKRELLLIIAFVVAGVIVYQATAPPPAPGSRGVSIGRIIDDLRREIRGNRASAEIRRSSTYAVAPGVTEIRFREGFSELTIAGEDRDDIALDMRIVSNGADQAEARKWAEETQVKVDTTATGIALAAEYSKGGDQRGYFTVKVPARLAIRTDQAANRASIAGVAGVEMVTARGDTTIRQISGRVALTHVGGDLIIDNVGSLKLTGRRTQATLTGIRGELSLDVQQNSEVVATGAAGPIAVEARSSEVTLSKLEGARGPVRVNAVGGSIALRGLGTEARVDGRNTEIDVEIAKPVPLTVYNEGDEPIDITPPEGGYTLDAVAADGRISVPQDSVEVTESEQEQRATGKINGGGPPITLRANRGNINVRAR